MTFVQNVVRSSLNIKKGYTQFQFHAVFTDHKVGIQKHKCRNPECDWQSTPTTTSVFGTSIHPDLAKLQCEQGALYSYREAQSNLEKLTVHRRSVNNHNIIKLMTNQVGALLAGEDLKPPAAEDCAPPAQEVIVQVNRVISPLRIRINAALKLFQQLSIGKRASARLASLITRLRAKAMHSPLRMTTSPRLKLICSMLH